MHCGLKCYTFYPIFLGMLNNTLLSSPYKKKNIREKCHCFKLYINVIVSIFMKYILYLTQKSLYIQNMHYISEFSNVANIVNNGI